MNNNYPQTFNTIGQCSISIEKVVYEFGFFNVNINKRLVGSNKEVVIVPSFYWRNLNFLFLHKFILELNIYFIIRNAFRRLCSCLVKRQLLINWRNNSKL